jgi:hypothetical protein
MDTRTPIHTFRVYQHVTRYTSRIPQSALIFGGNLAHTRSAHFTHLLQTQTYLASRSTILHIYTLADVFTQHFIHTFDFLPARCRDVTSKYYKYHKRVLFGKVKRVSTHVKHCVRAI